MARRRPVSSGRVRTRSGWPYELALGSLIGQWSAPHQESAVEKSCLRRSRFAQTLDVPKTVRLGLSLAAALHTAFLNSRSRIVNFLSLVAALLPGILNKLSDKLIVLALLNPSTAALHTAFLNSLNLKIKIANLRFQIPYFSTQNPAQHSSF